MTQVKNYRIGTYTLINGKYVLKNHNRTYRGKATKHVDKMNDKREEVRAGIAYIITCILILGGYAAFSVSNNIVLNVEAQGVKSEDVIVKDVAPVSYTGISYMETLPEIIEIKDEVAVEEMSVKERVLKVAESKNFEYTGYLLRLINCESKFNPNAINNKNNTPKGSRDRGIMQINDYWHKEISDAQAFNLEFSVSWAIDNINAGRQDMWSCDRIIKGK